MPTIDEVLLSASREKLGFENCIRDLTDEAKGILFSEMLFFVAAAGSPRPRRIIESGRARGLSTSILARCFPDGEIISVDLEECPEDVEHVNASKSSWANVRTIRGDSRAVLPEIVRPGDLVLIDGPKSFRAIELSLELSRLSTRPLFSFTFTGPVQICINYAGVSYVDESQLEILHYTSKNVWELLHTTFRDTVNDRICANTNSLSPFVLAYLPATYYRYAGFFTPVDNPPVVNLVNSGRTIPVKWQLWDATGTFISDLSSFQSFQSAEVSCDVAPTDTIPDSATTLSEESLKVDNAAAQFVYNWRTEKSWMGKCRQIWLTLADGTIHTATFQTIC